MKVSSGDSMPVVDRPLVTFAIFSYNQEGYIADAVKAAFAQTYSPLEILISDDCSTDKTFDVIRDLVSQYDGPHTVVCNRNPVNMGLINHINFLMETAKGELIIEAPGDDISMPQRTERLVEAYLLDGCSGRTIHSAVMKMDVSGGDIGVVVPAIVERSMSLRKVAVSGTAIIGASQAWPRKQIEIFGPIKRTGAYEDLVMAFRSMLLGGHVYIAEPLVRYRVGSGMSSQAVPENEKIADGLLRKIKVMSIYQAVIEQRQLDSKHFPDRFIAFLLWHAKARVSLGIAMRKWLVMRLKS